MKIILVLVLLTSAITTIVNTTLYATQIVDEPKPSLASFRAFETVGLRDSLTSYMTPEERVISSKANKAHRDAHQFWCIETYAECVVNNKPVPNEVIDILHRTTNEEEIEKIIEAIVNHIKSLSEKKSQGRFHRTKPMPSFLKDYFKVATPDMLDVACKPFIKDRLLSTASLLHMNILGSYWINNTENVDSLANYLIDNAKCVLRNSYITLETGCNSTAYNTIPVGIRYITATAAEIEGRQYFNDMNNLFEHHPEYELVVDFGNDISTANNWGKTTEFPPSIHKLSIVGINLVTIGSHFLNKCTGLTSITVPNSVTAIGNLFLYECSGLTSVTVPNRITAVGYYFLSDCSGLTSVTLPNSVTTIGNLFLYRCSGLTSVTVPNSVTTIGHGFLRGCSGITSVTVPNRITAVGHYFLSDCSGLTSVTIPNSVTTIEGFFLRECSGLTSVTIPNSVTTIGGFFLRECSGLTSVIIPNSVTTIGDFFLYGCSNLKEKNIKNENGDINEKAIKMFNDSNYIFD